MRGGLAAVLEEGVLGVRLRETFLVGVGEVDVVEREGYYREGIGGVAQRILQRRHLYSINIELFQSVEGMEMRRTRTVLPAP